MDRVPQTKCSRGEFNQWADELRAVTAWEVRTRQSALGLPVQWLEAVFTATPETSSLSDSVLLTACILFNADYRVPQLGFYASSLLSVDELRAVLPNLSFTNVLLRTAAAADVVASTPLVSCLWSEEVQRHLWLLHPCDTENMLLRCRFDGTQGSLLSVFVHATSRYFPFPASLVPKA